MLVIVLGRRNWNNDDDVTIVMMAMAMKGDRSPDDWASTRCVWGGMINPRCHCCHRHFQPRHFYVVVFVFIGVFISLSLGTMCARPLSAETATSSGE